QMRIQSRNGYNDGLDDLDPYFTCAEAIASLLTLEGDRLPRRLWEPAAGDGAIVHPLRGTGRSVIAFDIHDYGLEGGAIRDYHTADPPPGIEGNSLRKRLVKFLMSPYWCAPILMSKASNAWPSVPVIRQLGYGDRRDACQ